MRERVLGGCVAEDRFDTEDVFNEDYLYFYAERTGDERSDAEVELIWRLLDLEPGMGVLDLACGYGRIANRLAMRGCVVTGLDSSALFLDHARGDGHARGAVVDYTLGDMRRLPWSARFDCVISWFTAFGYFDDAGNKQVLSEVCRTLRPGGRFLLDMPSYSWLIRHYQRAIVNERDGNLLIDRGELDMLTSRHVVTRTVVRDGRTRHAQYFVRLLTFTELRDWLLSAGFSSVAGYGENGEPYTLESRRMIIDARRGPV